MSLIDEVRRAQVLAGEQAVMRHLEKIGFIQPKAEESESRGPDTMRSSEPKCGHCRLDALVILADNVMVELQKLLDGDLIRCPISELTSAVAAYAEARIQTKIEEGA